MTESIGGSRTARELLSKALSGDRVIVIEDASRRTDVVFCHVVEGRWTKDTANKPPVYIILVDFADFSYVTGDRAAIDAFNVGWGVLHEIDHVVHDSLDPQIEDESGECEGLINQMRRECGLAERAQYFFSHVPGVGQSGLMARYVRLAFDQLNLKTKKKRRYWLIWDASLVGGLTDQKQTADTR